MATVLARSRRTATVRDSYLELIERFPLRPIRSEKQLDDAIRTIDALLDRESLDAAEQDYLDVLSDLVEQYEEEQHPIRPLPDGQMLSYLIEQKGVTQAETADATGIAESTLSAVVHGKRKLSRSHIVTLCGYFRVEPGVFRFTS